MYVLKNSIWVSAGASSTQALVNQRRTRGCGICPMPPVCRRCRSGARGALGGCVSSLPTGRAAPAQPQGRSCG